MVTLYFVFVVYVLAFSLNRPAGSADPFRCLLSSIVVSYFTTIDIRRTLVSLASRVHAGHTMFSFGYVFVFFEPPPPGQLTRFMAVTVP